MYCPISTSRYLASKLAIKEYLIKFVGNLAVRVHLGFQLDYVIQKICAINQDIIQIQMSRTSKAQPPPPPVKQTPQLSWKDRLTAEDYDQLKQTFDIFDEDGSGSIDPAQINKILDELGLDKRNPFILSLINGLKEKNKPIQFPEFLDIICSKVGETKTKDGLKRVFALFDTDANGVIDHEEFRAISKQLHENLTDDDILEMMHSASVNHKTSSNEAFTFEEFYGIVSKFTNR